MRKKKVIKKSIDRTKKNVGKIKTTMCGEVYD
jgi:hypothetical protein